MTEDYQEHLFTCKVMWNYHLPTTRYEDVFSNDTDKLLALARDIQRISEVQMN